MTGGLARKLNLKPGMRLHVAAIPDAVRATLAADLGVDFDAGPTGPGEADAALLWTQNRTDIEAQLPAAKRALSPDGMLWICYPKKSSGIPSDLTRDEGWKPVEEAGWQTVRQVAVDDQWSALRFKKVADAAVRGDVDAQYSGAKAALRPIYDRLMAAALALGPDVSIYVRGNYVALSHRNHFAAISPSTARRIDLALKLKGREVGGRLLPHKSAAGGSFTHMLSLTSVDEIDAEVLDLLRAAYDAA